MAALLEISGLEAWYDDFKALHGLSLEAGRGRVAALVGANAAGKSTALNCVSGLIAKTKGRIVFDGRELGGLPPCKRAEMGLVQVPEGRRVFPFMTVKENLLLGAYSPEPRRRRAKNLDKVQALLPVLAERRSQMAGSLSGGEQQMLAIGRGLMAEPKLLMLDEPSLGLAPMYVEKVFELVRAISGEGVAILLVEQNVHHALSLADRGYVVENGRLALEGPGPALLGGDQLVTAYMGMGI
jgi:branched-chain amino acid transport system ATP-binding protein